VSGSACAVRLALLSGGRSDRLRCDRAQDDVMDDARRLELREIDTDRDGELTIRFRADSFTASFGSPDRFFADAGPGARDYLAKLREHNRDIPGSCVHAWLGDRIVGQLELRRDREDPTRARVLLYYLVADQRGSGLGDELDAHVDAVARRCGFSIAELRVSPTNARALAYYRKHGWSDRGPDPLHPEVHVMERDVRGADA
jgi:GNAT superfamily N-acetyltransferase